MPSAGPGTTSLAAALLQLSLIVAMLVAGFGGLGLLLRWFTGELELERSARRRARGLEPARSPNRPLQEVAGDLRRLGRELACVPTGVAQARRRGLTAAYDDVLVEAARLLEVPEVLRATPEGSGRDLERMRLLSSLEAAGLRVGP